MVLQETVNHCGQSSEHLFFALIPKRGEVLQSFSTSYIGERMGFNCTVTEIQNRGDGPIGFLWSFITLKMLVIKNDLK